MDKWDSDLHIWEDYIEQAVNIIVKTSYKGFNTATSSFGNILQCFTDSQAREPISCM